MIFDLQFFGGGGSSTEQVKKRDPMNPLYERAQSDMFNDLKPYWDQVVNDKDGFQRAYQMGQDALANAGGLMERIPGMFDRQDDVLNRWDNMLTTGVLPQTLVDNMQGSIQKGLNQSVGSMLNRLGSSGVINSTGMTTGLNNLTGNAADAMQRGYADLWGTSLSNYGNMFNSIGSQIGNMNQSMDTMLKVPGTAMDAFMAPAMPFYNLNQDYLRNYYGHEDYDTVVHQGK